MRVALVSLLLISACQARIGDPLAGGLEPPGATPPIGRPPPGAPPPPPNMPGPTATPTAAPQLVGLRRLTNRELVAAVQAIFPEASFHADVLPPDTRQSDFARNRAQIVDVARVRAIQAIAEEVAASMVQDHPAVLAPCAMGGAPSTTCSGQVIARIAELAFRRTPTALDLAGLAQVEQIGRTERDGWYGLELVIEALLQSPSFLYLAEIGSPTAPDRAELDGREIAEAIAFLLIGGATDSELLRAAAARELETADGREAQARRLYAQPASKSYLAGALLEWLRIDRLNDIAKDANVYPTFFALRPDMWSEALALATASLSDDTDTLAHLLGAEETEISPPLAAFYRISGSGRVSLAGSGRRGILSQAGFLAVFASPTESSPVKRGNAILKKLLCVELSVPTNLNVQIVPPAPDPALTTRERYAVHSRDPVCQGCHAQIDPLGFAFEGFDGMGGARSEENGKPIDTRVHVGSSGISGDYPNHLELIDALASSGAVRSCFRRNVIRFALGERDRSLEEVLLREVEARSPDSGKLSDVLAAIVRSEQFVLRRIEP